jgi:hypothetical protein
MALTNGTQNTASTNLPVPPLAKTPPTYTPAKLKTAGSTYKETPATETGQGVTYSGQSSGEQLATDRKGLVSMLDENNELLRLSRAQGARSSEARGLGTSTLRERASEGAAIATALPMVQQASAQGSSERMAAQQATATSQVAASQRKLQELMANKELAVKAGDTAAARQLSADITNEQNSLSVFTTEATLASNKELANLDVSSRERIANLGIESQERIVGLQLNASDKQQLLDLKSRFDLNQANLTSNEKLALQELTSREAIAEASITSQELMSQQSDDLQRDLQSVDIGYKEWLAQTTFENSSILQGNQQASSAYSDFTMAAGEILNNPDTSAAQKRAAIQTIKTGLTDNLLLISETSGIDLTAFLPASTTNANGTPTATVGQDNSTVPNFITNTNNNGNRGFNSRFPDQEFNRRIPGKP